MKPVRRSRAATQTCDAEHDRAALLFALLLMRQGRDLVGRQGRSRLELRLLGAYRDVRGFKHFIEAVRQHIAQPEADTLQGRRGSYRERRAQQQGNARSHRVRRVLDVSSTRCPSLLVPKPILPRLDDGPDALRALPRRKLPLSRSETVLMIAVGALPFIQQEAHDRFSLTPAGEAEAMRLAQQVDAVWRAFKARLQSLGLGGLHGVHLRQIDRLLPRQRIAAHATAWATGVDPTLFLNCALV